MTKFELVSKYDTEKCKFLIPQRQTQFSAGYDFKASKDALVKAGTMKPVLVPTGIKVKLERDQVLILANRSSNALKRGLIVPNGVGVIDADYYNNPDNEGEIMGMFINVGGKDYTIKQGDRIMQGIITAYSTVEDDKPAAIERKGGFGSTGKVVDKDAPELIVPIQKAKDEDLAPSLAKAEKQIMDENLTLKEACEKAQKEGKSISRHSWGKYGMRLIPTNSWNCVIIISGSNNKPIESRWNPYLDDLIANDWYVTI